MQQRTEFLRPAIAAVTFAASAIALAPAGHAAPAETCLSAPKGAAPQGSHWYYRLERPSMRKCWYLAAKGQKIARRAAPRPMPQAEPDEEDTAEAPAASVPAAPVANVPPAPAAEPQPVITTLSTRNVSNIEQVAQAQAPAAPDLTQPPAAPSLAPSTTATAAPPLAPERAPNNPQAATPIAAPPSPQPAAAAVDEKTGAAAGAMPTLQWLLGAIALLGLLASLGLFVMAALRRRNDVRKRWRDTAALPFEDSPETAAQDTPAFRPMPAPDPVRPRDLAPMRQHDDVDEILHRLARRRRVA